MMKLILQLVLMVCAIATMAQQSGQPDSKKETPPRGMCDAAASQLRNSGTNEVVLMMTVDTRGRVQSFKTESPKGLRLEKMKETATAIKAMQFDPAKKDGHPVTVMISIRFDCSQPATDAPKKP